MSVLYVGCMKFPTNRFVRNFCKKKKKKKKPKKWDFKYTIFSQKKKKTPKKHL
jgi:hypothetical protein